MPAHNRPAQENTATKGECQQPDLLSLAHRLERIFPTPAGPATVDQIALQLADRASRKDCDKRLARCARLRGTCCGSSYTAFLEYNFLGAYGRCCSGIRNFARLF